MDEKHILTRARRGETAAFEELVRLYEKRVYAVALRSSGNPEDAADIVQEVFCAHGGRSSPSAATVAFPLGCSASR